jgi:molecular chaperone GrpE
MEDEKIKDEKIEEAETAEPEKDEADEGEAKGGADKSERKAKKGEAKLRSRISELEAELKKTEEKLAETEESRLRLAAEYDNFRRRSKDERDAMYADAVGESVRELLPIIDNLKLATVYDDPEKIAEGVKLILKTVPQALSKLGVEEFGEVGEKFDPALHNAVMHEESEEFGENEISAVLQCGYKRGDKILRFAMVKVAN